MKRVVTGSVLSVVFIAACNNAAPPNASTATQGSALATAETTATAGDALQCGEGQMLASMFNLCRYNGARALLRNINPIDGASAKVTFGCEGDLSEETFREAQYEKPGDKAGYATTCAPGPTRPREGGACPRTARLDPRIASASVGRWGTTPATPSFQYVLPTDWRDAGAGRAAEETRLQGVVDSICRGFTSAYPIEESAVTSTVPLAWNGVCCVVPQPGDPARRPFGTSNIQATRDYDRVPACPVVSADGAQYTDGPLLDNVVCQYADAPPQTKTTLGQPTCKADTPINGGPVSRIACPFTWTKTYAVSAREVGPPNTRTCDYGDVTAECPNVVSGAENASIFLNQACDAITPEELIATCEGIVTAPQNTTPPSTTPANNAGRCCTAPGGTCTVNQDRCRSGFVPQQDGFVCRCVEQGPPPREGDGEAAGDDAIDDVGAGDGGVDDAAGYGGAVDDAAGYGGAVDDGAGYGGAVDDGAGYGGAVDDGAGYGGTVSWP